MKTYELAVSFPNQALAIKKEVKDWLLNIGEKSFVEGVVEGINIDFDYDSPDTDYYKLLGGNESPIVLYSYQKDHIEHLRHQLETRFSDKITCTTNSIDSTTWQEGWKEGFQPITTNSLYIFPPWNTKKPDTGKIPIEIDPGMAFGTGQHATTQLCLGELEKIAEEFINKNEIKRKKVLDVGTGSGILAIGAAKLGFSHIIGTDIEEDAIKAASENAEINKVAIGFEKGTFPSSTSSEDLYDVIFANILSSVLRKIIPSMTRYLKINGTMILSGILQEEQDLLTALCREQGLSISSISQKEDWICLRLKKENE